VAQWSHADKTLLTKVVYYGPAFGGKTTNLETLHRITDPQGVHKLLSIKTADDRTLFFDLLPFDLGEILGYQVGIKLYTVPGQVRYDTTRQMVLAGADAVVFVVDSSRQREEQDRWSLQDLRRNMSARGLNHEVVPVIYQFNKQDLPRTATPEECRVWLRLEPDQGLSAVATEGEGVLETFIAACHAMLLSLTQKAEGRTRGAIDVRNLQQHLDRAFSPHLARRLEATRHDDVQEHLHRTPIVIEQGDLLENSIQAGLDLGQALSAESAERSRAERELLSLRGLSEALRRVGASFDRAEIVHTVLEVAARVLKVPAVSLVSRSTEGPLVCESAFGTHSYPLVCCSRGRDLLARMLGSGRTCVVSDLGAEFESDGRPEELGGLRSVVMSPVDSTSDRALLAYAAEPDGCFNEDDVRFLAILSAHLAVGLEKSRLYSERARQAERTFERSRADLTADTRRQVEALLDDLLGAIEQLRQRKTKAKERAALIAQMDAAGERLREMFRDPETQHPSTGTDGAY